MNMINEEKIKWIKNRLMDEYDIDWYGDTTDYDESIEEGFEEEDGFEWEEGEDGTFKRRWKSREDDDDEIPDAVTQFVQWGIEKFGEDGFISKFCMNEKDDDVLLETFLNNGNNLYRCTESIQEIDPEERYFATTIWMTDTDKNPEHSRFCDFHEHPHMKIRIVFNKKKLIEYANGYFCTDCFGDCGKRILPNDMKYFLEMYPNAKIATTTEHPAMAMAFTSSKRDCLGNYQYFPQNEDPKEILKSIEEVWLLYGIQKTDVDALKNAIENLRTLGILFPIKCDYDLSSFGIEIKKIVEEHNNIVSGELEKKRKREDEGEDEELQLAKRTKQHAVVDSVPSIPP